MVRRYLEIADPASTGGFDAGSLLADAANLFGHEARRRRIALGLRGGAPGAVRAAGDPAQGRAAAAGPPVACHHRPRRRAGGSCARAAVRRAEVAALARARRREPADPALAWVGAVVAAGAREMGGRFEESSRDGIVRAALVLPKERAAVKYRLLIVDDETDSREALAELADRWGYEVQTAADGTEALRRAIEWHPDVILTDLVMPNMDGLWLLARAARRAAGLPGGAAHRPRHRPDRGAGHPRGRLRLHREAARDPRGSGSCSTARSRRRRPCARCSCCAGAWPRWRPAPT